MEMSLSSNSAFVRYVYTGKMTLVFDDHNDEYELEVATDDEVSIRVSGSKVEIRPSDSNEIFIATTTDKKYLRLMKYSEPEEFVFVPHPKKPSYPFIPKLTFDLLPKLYEYFNAKYFNGMCPKSLLFKRSTSNAFLGLATLNPNVRGKQLYTMTVNMKSVASDTLLFVDVLLHEMIHLYLFRKGIEEKNMAFYRDGHGKFFQEEMRRLNKHGFNVSITLEWEKREDNEDLELNVIRVTSPDLDKTQYTKYFWSDKNLEEDFDRIVSQLVSGDSFRLNVELLVSTSMKVRTFPKMSANGKIPAAKVKLWWKPIDISGRVLKQIDTATESHRVQATETKVAKKEEPHYAQSYQLFAAYMKRTYPNQTDGRLRTLWFNFPVNKITPHAEADLVDVAKSIKRGVNDAEIKRKLTNVFARFDDRCNQYEYRKIVNKLIEKHRLDVLRNYSQLGL